MKLGKYLDKSKYSYRGVANPLLGGVDFLPDEVGRKDGVGDARWIFCLTKSAEKTGATDAQRPTFGR